MLAALAALLGASPPPPPPPDPLAGLDLTRLKAGDLVLREGRGWRADAVRLAGRFRYTHVGLLVLAPEGWQVLHAAPPDNSDLGGVRLEALEHFAAADQAHAIAIWRRDNANTHAVLAAARELIGRPFDDQFDLDTLSALYCTELVWRAYAAAGDPLPRRTAAISAGPLSGRYLLPAGLLAAGRFRPVPLEKY